MKQKRKAKSLIPMHFNWNYGLLTNIILIIGGMLCFFALSLQTISVDALGMNGLYFSGYDDNTEVIYHMYYVHTEDQSEAGVISEMYMNQSGNDSNFYIVPSRVLIQPSLEGGTHTLPNLVGYDNYVNILGGNDIKLYSDNMSVIAGEDNIANEGNNNSVLLGGHGNVIGNGNGFGLPVVVLGGVDNSVGNNQNGNIVIGGSDNKIGDGVSNSNIIGGEYNKVSGNGNIVGGTNVDVGNSIGNVFVFSDSDSTFSPKSSNAFYLKTDNGVGLNEDPLVHDDWDNNGVSSSGSVSLGNIDINSVVCKPTTDGNLGVEGSWKGCLVGCTSASANDGQKRDLLDQSKRCKELCLNEGKCKDPSTGDNQNSSGHCSRGLDLDREKYCPGLDPTKWTNVVFDVILVDNGECGGNGNVNQCVYQCKDHYTLTGGKCMGSCQKTWDDDSWVAHGDVVWAFTDDEIQCSKECRNLEVMLKCLDGYWSRSTNNLYNDCTTYGRVCSSDYYKFTRDDIANANCSEYCDNYTVSNNSCLFQNTLYKCECNEGFVFNSTYTACIQPNDSLCGSANGVESQEKPTSNLCTGGATPEAEPEIVNGMWDWTCKLSGTEDKQEICRAPIPGVEPEYEYECKGPEPKNAELVEGTDENLTRDVDNRVYKSLSAVGKNKCAYLCKKGYTYVVNYGVPQCVECVDGTYDSATETCQIAVGCSAGGYVYGPSPSTPGGYACLRLGNCGYNGSYPEEVPDPNGVSVPYKDVQPVGVSDMDWTCVSGTPSKYQCEYECKAGYVCSEGRCLKDRCPSSIPTPNIWDGKSWHYGTTKNVIKYIVGLGTGEWIHYEGQTEVGCYYECKAGTYYVEKSYSTALSETPGCFELKCPDLPSTLTKDKNSIVKTEHPRWHKNLLSDGSRGTEDDWQYNESTNITSEGCYYACNTASGYVHQVVNGEDVCVKPDQNICPAVPTPNIWDGERWHYGTTKVDQRIIGLGGMAREHDVGQTEDGCYYECKAGTYYVEKPYSTALNETPGCFELKCPDLPEYLSKDKNSIITTEHPRWHKNLLSDGSRGTEDDWQYNESTNITSMGCYYRCNTASGYVHQVVNGEDVCVKPDQNICPAIEKPSIWDGERWHYGTTKVDERIVGLGGMAREYDVGQTEDGCYYKCKAGTYYVEKPYSNSDVAGCFDPKCPTLPSDLSSASIIKTEHPRWNMNLLPDGSIGNDDDWQYSESTNIISEGCYYRCDGSKGYVHKVEDGKDKCVEDNGGGGGGGGGGEDPECNADDGFELVNGECLSICRECAPDCGWNKTQRLCTSNETTDDITELECASIGEGWHLITSADGALCVYCVGGTWNETLGKCN